MHQRWQMPTSFDCSYSSDNDSSDAPPNIRAHTQANVPGEADGIQVVGIRVAASLAVGTPVVEHPVVVGQAGIQEVEPPVADSLEDEQSEVEPPVGSHRQVGFRRQVGFHRQVGFRRQDGFHRQDDSLDWKGECLGDYLLRAPVEWMGDLAGNRQPPHHHRVLFLGESLVDQGSENH